jgi:prolyl 4-hydroxylase
VAAPYDILQQAYSLVAQGRDADALALVDRGVAQGNPFAFFVLADWRLRGSVVPPDAAQARALFGRAGEAGMPTAGFFYTNFLAAGVGGDPDWPGALTRLRAEAQQDPRREAALALIGRMDIDKLGRPKALPAGQVICETPDVRVFPKLFSSEECAYLSAAAEPEFKRSTVSPKLGADQYLDAARNSEGSTLHWLIANPAIHALNLRLAAASDTAVEQGEPLQILRYAVGGEFRPHFDASEGISNQRIKTALVYLNDDYEGGATRFLESGLTFKGETGDAIVFRNATDDGRPDPMSRHAGLPVTRGVKLIASRWIRAHRYDGFREA